MPEQSHYEQHKNFLDKYNDYVDNIRDSKRFATELFTSDATFVIGNFPVATGHSEIENSCQQMYNVTKAIKHNTITIHSIRKDYFITEFSVEYTVGDDNKVLPLIYGSAFVELDSNNVELIKNYRCYINVDPLFIAIGLDVTAGEDGLPTFVPRK